MQTCSTRDSILAARCFWGAQKLVRAFETGLVAMALLKKSKALNLQLGRSEILPCVGDLRAVVVLLHCGAFKLF